jgi:RNA recognition motif-containing protein
VSSAALTRSPQPQGAIGTKRPSPATNRIGTQNLADYNLSALAAAQSMYPTALQIPTNPQYNAAGHSPSTATPISALPNSPYGYSPLAAMNMMGMMHLANYGFNNAALGHTVAGQPGLPALNIPAAQAYSPIAGLASANGGNGRTVYVGNLPPDALIDELLSLVKFGPIESVRILGEKSCAFISFLDGATAAAFHADATLKKLSLHGVDLKIGWGKPSPVPAPVLLAMQQSNATRNVYLGGLDENVTEAQLRDDLSRFGLIDQIKIVRDKGIGFVHFLSIATATKVVNTLPTEPAWAGKRVNYGKDRCAFVPKTTPAAQAAVQIAANTLSQASPNIFGPFSPYDSPTTPASAMAFMAAAAGGMSPGAGGLNRTVYLGNIHPETTTEDLCNAIRGGVLQSIRYMQDKHIAVSGRLPFSIKTHRTQSALTVHHIH